MNTSGEFIEDITQSLFRYVSGTEYTARGVTGILGQIYSGIHYTLSFPDDFEAMKLPTLAFEEPIVNSPVTITFGGQPIQEVSMTYVIYGFAGSSEDVGTNRRERIRLMSDVCGLLYGIEDGTKYISIYDYASGSKNYLGKVEIQNVTSRTINPTSALDADKYRFVIDVDIKTFV